MALSFRTPNYFFLYNPDPEEKIFSNAIELFQLLAKEEAVRLKQEEKGEIKFTKK